MNMEIKNFCGQGFEVRAFDKDGEAWFVGKDVAEMLGYSNTRDAINTHCKGGSEMRLPSNGGTQTIKIIPERDVYRLIMRSKLPAAEKFEEWVVGDVLPSIRKRGGYIHASENESPETIMARAVLLAQDKIKELEVKVEESKPSIAFHDVATNGQTEWTITVAAKELNMSLNNLRDRLVSVGCLKKVKHGTNAFRYWPKKEFYENGIVAGCSFENINSKTMSNYAFTPKGMDWIRDMLKYGEEYAMESIGVGAEKDRCVLSENEDQPCVEEDMYSKVFPSVSRRTQKVLRFLKDNGPVIKKTQKTIGGLIRESQNEVSKSLRELERVNAISRCSSSDGTYAGDVITVLV